MPGPPGGAGPAKSPRHSTGSVLVARPIAAHTPAITRPRFGRTRPYRVAQPAVPGGGGGNPPGGGNPAPPNGGGGGTAPGGGGGTAPGGGGGTAPGGGGGGTQTPGSEGACAG